MVTMQCDMRFNIASEDFNIDIEIRNVFFVNAVDIYDICCVGA
jgi:hypothetical protein